ncbi:E3 SUMO-protein ligase nse2 [Aspergillus udagawae]|uniref:E3 SUMO-protein ligase nse2 n=1 Tax=Aspergillus udagawae TaxID=91492 RepID=A0A8H3RGH4_9EURO|nr:E3 SUMO-protein ligase nse2 [Aspergillus udagawae]
MSATPDTRRHRHASRNDRTSTNRHAHSRTSAPPLPAYEPPIAPLNAAGHNAIIALLNAPSLRQLKTHIQSAEEKLTDSAGEVNERLTDARVRYQKERARKRRRANGETPAAEGAGAKEEDEEDEEEDDDDGEEINRLARLEEQVQSVTEELEARMRQTIDAEVKLEGLKGVLADMAKEAEEATVAGAGAGARGRRGGRARRRRGDEEEDQDPEEEGDEDYEATPEPQMTGIPPSRRLGQKLDEESARWIGQSLTQRYSTNNAYIGFYRIIHEAKHPGDDIPPLPHASTWFADMEDPRAITTSTTDQTSARRTRQRGSPSPADSDEIAIERERISLKCPLTLLPFRDPVTSTKCPHSFEREAITDMIAHSSTTVPGPPSRGRRNRIRSVKCPVCSVVLTADDLRSDPVLLRRVRRAEAASQREAEDDELDADGNPRKRPREGRKSGITVASDDDSEAGGSMHQETADAAVRIKQERLSQAQSALSDDTDDDE